MTISLVSLVTVMILFVTTAQAAPTPSPPVLYYSSQDSNNYYNHNNGYNNAPVELSYSDAAGYLVQGEVQEDLKCSSHAWAYYENRTPMYYDNLINCLTSDTNPGQQIEINPPASGYAPASINPQTACSAEEQYSTLLHKCVGKSHKMSGIVG